MKKLLVSCDEYVYSLNGQYYVREFGSTLLSRYLSVFDSLRLVARTKVVNSEAELGIYCLQVKDNNIEIFPIPFFQGPIQYAQKYFKVNRVIKSSVDGCHAALFRIPSTIGFAVLKEARKRKMPYSVEVVANPKELVLYTQNVLVRALLNYMHHQQVRACKNADGVSYVTRYSLQKIYPAGKNDFFESYYSSVNLSDSYFGAPRQYPLHKPFVLCHVANPIRSRFKGHTTLIDTVKILLDKGYDIIAQFAGDGELVQHFKQYAEKVGVAGKINFVGLLKQKQLEAFLENSDMMIFPSKSEGLPRVMIEAMASGLPCLSTFAGGIPELLTDDLLFGPDDSAGFAEKIAEIIDNTTLYTKLSTASFEKAKEYRADLLQTRRVEFYQKLKAIS